MQDLRINGSDGSQEIQAGAVPQMEKEAENEQHGRHRERASAVESPQHNDHFSGPKETLQTSDSRPLQNEILYQSNRHTESYNNNSYTVPQTDDQYTDQFEEHQLFASNEIKVQLESGEDEEELEGVDYDNGTSHLHEITKTSQMDKERKQSMMSKSEEELGSSSPGLKSTLQQAHGQSQPLIVQRLDLNIGSAPVEGGKEHKMSSSIESSSFMRPVNPESDTLNRTQSNWLKKSKNIKDSLGSDEVKNRDNLQDPAFQDQQLQAYDENYPSYHSDTVDILDIQMPYELRDKLSKSDQQRLDEQFANIRDNINRINKLKELFDEVVKQYQNLDSNDSEKDVSQIPDDVLNQLIDIKNDLEDGKEQLDYLIRQRTEMLKEINEKVLRSGPPLSIDGSCKTGAIDQTDSNHSKSGENSILHNEDLSRDDEANEQQQSYGYKDLQSYEAAYQQDVNNSSQIVSSYMTQSEKGRKIMMKKKLLTIKTSSTPSEQSRNDVEHPQKRGQAQNKESGLVSNAYQDNRQNVEDAHNIEVMNSYFDPSSTKQVNKRQIAPQDNEKLDGQKHIIVQYNLNQKNMLVAQESNKSQPRNTEDLLKEANARSQKKQQQKQERDFYHLGVVFSPRMDNIRQNAKMGQESSRGGSTVKKEDEANEATSDERKKSIAKSGTNTTDMVNPMNLGAQSAKNLSESLCRTTSLGQIQEVVKQMEEEKVVEENDLEKTNEESAEEEDTQLYEPLMLAESPIINDDLIEETNNYEQPELTETTLEVNQLRSQGSRNEFAAVFDTPDCTVANQKNITIETSDFRPNPSDLLIAKDQASEANQLREDEQEGEVKPQECPEREEEANYNNYNNMAFAINESGNPAPNLPLNGEILVEGVKDPLNLSSQVEQAYHTGATVIKNSYDSEKTTEKAVTYESNGDRHNVNAGQTQYYGNLDGNLSYIQSYNNTPKRFDAYNHAYLDQAQEAYLTNQNTQMQNTAQSLEIISEEAGSDILQASTRQKRDQDSDNQYSNNKNLNIKLKTDIELFESNYDIGLLNQEDQKTLSANAKSAKVGLEILSENVSIGPQPSSTIMRSLTDNDNVNPETVRTLDSNRKETKSTNKKKWSKEKLQLPIEYDVKYVNSNADNDGSSKMNDAPLRAPDPNQRSQSKSKNNDVNKQYVYKLKQNQLLVPPLKFQTGPAESDSGSHPQEYKNEDLIATDQEEDARKAQFEINDNTDTLNAQQEMNISEVPVGQYVTFQKNDAFAKQSLAKHIGVEDHMIDIQIQERKGLNSVRQRNIGNQSTTKKKKCGEYFYVITPSKQIRVKRKQSKQNQKDTKRSQNGREEQLKVFYQLMLEAQSKNSQQNSQNVVQITPSYEGRSIVGDVVNNTNMQFSNPEFINFQNINRAQRSNVTTLGSDRNQESIPELPQFKRKKLKLNEINQQNEHFEQSSNSLVVPQGIAPMTIRDNKMPDIYFSNQKLLGSGAKEQQSASSLFGQRHKSLSNLLHSAQAKQPQTRHMAIRNMLFSSQPRIVKNMPSSEEQLSQISKKVPIINKQTFNDFYNQQQQQSQQHLGIPILGAALPQSLSSIPMQQDKEFQLRSVYMQRNQNYLVKQIKRRKRQKESNSPRKSLQGIGEHDQLPLQAGLNEGKRMSETNYPMGKSSKQSLNPMPLETGHNSLLANKLKENLGQTERQFFNMESLNLYKVAKFQERQKFYMGGNASNRSRKAQQSQQPSSSRRNAQSQLRNMPMKDLIGDPEAAQERMRCTSSLRALNDVPGQQQTLIKHWPQVQLQPTKLALKRILQYNQDIQNKRNELDDLLPINFANNPQSQSALAAPQQALASSQSTFSLQPPGINAFQNPLSSQIVPNSYSALTTLEQQSLMKISNRNMHEFRRQMAQTETKHADNDKINPISDEIEGWWHPTLGSNSLEDSDFSASRGSQAIGQRILAKGYMKPYEIVSQLKQPKTTMQMIKTGRINVINRRIPQSNDRGPHNAI